MKTISRYIMTLALLLTAVTGAWAQDAYEQFTTADGNGAKLVFTGEHFKITGTKIDDYGMYVQSDCPVTISALNGETITKVEMTIYYLSSWNTTHTLVSTPDATIDGAYSIGQTFTITPNGANASEVTLSANVDYDNAQLEVIEWKVYYTAEAPLTVAWNASTKTGTFAMPGSDVVLTPIYAKAAAFATTGTEPDVKTQLPEAAEGVIAGTDASLIAEGTGIVAFAGTSAEDTQGTVMYAIGTSATEAPALTAFNATVPTAKNVADDGADVYVWYYIKGADAPANTEATEENTFNDTEPACLTVQVLTNKFDIQFNAANANTIEAGKATITVDDQSATVTEGKLEGVKMGSEVKLKANTGYKFRKVEMKKKAAGKPLANATAEDIGKVVGADGKIYATKAAAEAANTTAVAMIAYVGSSTDHATYTHGLAIALADESNSNWNTAKSTCEGKSAVTNAAWLLPSLNQWKAMFKAFGNDDAKYAGLNSALAAAGGDSSKLQMGEYWSSSLNVYNELYVLSINESDVTWGIGMDNEPYRVRACLAF